MLLAKPKSQIFTMLSSARRMFLAARSPCITCKLKNTFNIEKNLWYYRITIMTAVM
jgi:hypothetical protein